MFGNLADQPRFRSYVPEGHFATAYESIGTLTQPCRVESSKNRLMVLGKQQAPLAAFPMICLVILPIRLRCAYV